MGKNTGACLPDKAETLTAHWFFPLDNKKIKCEENANKSGFAQWVTFHYAESEKAYYLDMECS